MARAQRDGLADLVARTLLLKAKGGVNAHLKVPALVAGMVAGADSVDEMDLMPHGGMGRLFTGARVLFEALSACVDRHGRHAGRPATQPRTRGEEDAAAGVVLRGGVTAPGGRHELLSARLLP
jgi:hypothetical protein